MTGVGAVMGRFISRAAEPVVSLAEFYNAFGSGGGVFNAVFTIAATGFVNATGNPSEPWIVPQTGMGNYQVLASLLEGELSSGTVGTWLSLSTSRSWEVSSPDFDLNQASLLIQIRRASDSVVVASTSVYLSA